MYSVSIFFLTFFWHYFQVFPSAPNLSLFMAGQPRENQTSKVIASIINNQTQLKPLTGTQKIMIKIRTNLRSILTRTLHNKSTWVSFCCFLTLYTPYQFLKTSQRRIEQVYESNVLQVEDIYQKLEIVNEDRQGFPYFLL